MRYIGQHSSKEFDKYYYGSGRLIKEALSEFGHDNFKCEIIEWCKTYEELNTREIYWINKNRSEDTKKKISETRIKNNIALGVNNPFYGKHHNKETREMISNIQKGRIYINNGTNTKRVKPEELDNYLSNGWVKGRILRKKVS